MVAMNNLLKGVDREMSFLKKAYKIQISIFCSDANVFFYFRLLIENKKKEKTLLASMKPFIVLKIVAKATTDFLFRTFPLCHWTIFSRVRPQEFTPPSDLSSEQPY